ncbi:hypothetical protein SAZ11_59305 [Streptomyces sp. FXJ1.4098]|nr:hypothetical protein [Streptomyces sp. FXJ1.4098]
MTQRQMELLFGEGRHPDADRMERERLDAGADPTRRGWRPFSGS